MIAHTRRNPAQRPMPLSRVQISTDLKLHPGFIANPRVFTRNLGIELADDFSPETTFRRDPSTDSKEEKDRAKIHLVGQNLIRLSVKRFGDRFHIKTIDMNPSLLLHGVECRMLAESDLALSLSILKATVSPLLDDRKDACHIIPGLACGQPVARWRSIECGALLRGVDVRDLHNLSHSMTQPAEGVEAHRIRLEGESKALAILFEKAICQADDPDDPHEVEGTRVTITVRKHLLGWLDSSLSTKPMDLVAFRPSTVASVLERVVSELQGICLPVPEDWSGTGDPVTHAKALALLSIITPVPIEELIAMDEEIRHPSQSTRKRLKKDIPAALAGLRPTPVSELFQPLDTLVVQSGDTRRRTVRMDPSIAAIYGPL